MAIYNLFAGGRDRLAACLCTSAEGDLPVFAQPDQRADGGYGYRSKVEWREFMQRLAQYYGLKPSDLKVGDRLRLFLSPNHATLKNLFVDFKKPEAGFEFKLQTVEGLALEADKYTSTYDDVSGRVLTCEKAEGLPEGLGGAVAPFTQFSFVLKNLPHTAKVDAVEMEITALPAAFAGNMDVLFARRFEMDGAQL